MHELCGLIVKGGLGHGANNRKQVHFMYICIVCSFNELLHKAVSAFLETESPLPLQYEDVQP